MASMLIYTSPARGHLFPVMDLALALKTRGHTVRLRTLSSELELVARAGLEAKGLAPAIEARTIDDWTSRSPMASVKKAMQTFLDRAAMELDDLVGAIAAERPDLLLVDTNCWGAHAVAEASGLPWAVWHPFPMPLPSKDAPPFGPGLAPARGPLGRLRDALLQPLVIGPLQKVVPELNRVRARAGAPPLGHITELFRRPPVLLHLTAEPFEYPRRDWPKNIHHVGPGLWSPPATAPAWLAKCEKPIVLVTCSTEYQDDGALVQAALDAFGADPSVQLVCTTAGVDPGLFQPPAGVILERFVPHALVLPQTCAVVCHGGMGITQRALAAGVPPCVVPWGRDQLEVGRRVEESKSGTMLPRGKLSGPRLAAAVAQARGRVEGARRIQAAFAQAGGAPRAAELLEGLLRGNGAGLNAA
jgi:MGT family glycosyltransferase